MFSIRSESKTEKLMCRIIGLETFQVYLVIEYIILIVNLCVEFEFNKIKLHTKNDSGRSSARAKIIQRIPLILKNCLI